MELSILGLIPARGGSKGLPRKNVRSLDGIPLIAHTIGCGLQSKCLSKLVVSTDDQQIAEISRNLGAQVPFMRPAELAADDSPTIDTVVHALQYYQSRGEYFDAVCLMQPTVPFRMLDEVNGAIRKFLQTQADSLISVREIPHDYNPHWAFVHDLETKDHLSIATGDKKIISRRQDLPKAYHRDGSIYITKTEVVLNDQTLYGKNITYYENTTSPYVNIDTAEDWLKAESHISANES